MIRTPESISSWATCCAWSAGTATHADDDVLLAHRVREPARVVDLHRADRPPDLLRVVVEDRRDVDPVLREDRRAGDRLAEPAGADERDVVLPLRPQDLADLAEQRVDVVADAALAELAEGGQVAADLRRVDVRVVRDLLRGDPVLAHLLRLGQNLEVPAQPGRDSDRQPIRSRRHCERSFATRTIIVPVPPRSVRRTVTSSAAQRATLCGRQPAPEGVLVDVVGEEPLAVELDHREPLAVARLELGRRRRSRPPRARTRARPAARAPARAPARRGGSPRAW